MPSLYYIENEAHKITIAKLKKMEHDELLQTYVIAGLFSIDKLHNPITNKRWAPVAKRARLEIIKRMKS